MRLRPSLSNTHSASIPTTMKGSPSSSNSYGLLFLTFRLVRLTDTPARENTDAPPSVVRRRIPFAASASSQGFDVVHDGAVEPGRPPVSGDDANGGAFEQARQCPDPAGSLSVGERQALGPKDFLHPSLAQRRLEVGSRRGRSVDGKPLVDTADPAVQRVKLVGDDDMRCRFEAVADPLDRTLVATGRQLLEGEVVCHAVTLRTRKLLPRSKSRDRR